MSITKQVNRVLLVTIGLFVVLLVGLYVYYSRESLIISDPFSAEGPIIEWVSVISIGGTTPFVAERNGDNCNEEEIIFLRTDYEDKDFLIDTCYNINSGVMRAVKALK